MRTILFLGQKPVGEACFDLLLKRRDALRVAMAVSNAGTDVWWASAGVREKAEQNAIGFLDNASRREDAILDAVAALKVDTILSVQHPWILSGRILESVGGRAFNLHNARLPDYKGYNACNHAILNGDETFTSTVHWMDPAVDAGPLAFTETFPLARDETAISLYHKAEKAGLRAFARLVDALADGGDIPAIPLAGEGRFYARDSIAPLRRIVNPNDLQEVDRKARAFHFPPFEPAYILDETGKKPVAPRPGESRADQAPSSPSTRMV